MRTLYHRRNFLRLAGATAGAFAFAGTALRPLPAAAAEDAAQPLADGIAVLTGTGCNVVAVRSDDGLLLVDGGREAHAAETLQRAHRAVDTRNVATLFNTHWHHDHVGCNRVLGERGVPIVAHERTRLWLGSTVTWPWDDQRFEPLDEAARPGDTFHSTIERTIGGRAVRGGHLLQAHTDGDIYLHFPDANVLVAGGAVASDGWPFIDWWTGGWIGGMVDALDRLVEIADDHTLIVPGSGPVLDREELAAQRDMYGEIHLRLRDMLMDGRSPEEALAARPADGYRPEWGDPGGFLDMAFRSQWAHEVPNA